MGFEKLIDMAYTSGLESFLNEAPLRASTLIFPFL